MASVYSSVQRSTFISDMKQNRASPGLPTNLKVTLRLFISIDLNKFWLCKKYYWIYKYISTISFAGWFSFWKCFSQRLH